MALNDIVIDRDSQQLINAIDITDGASATGIAATALGAGSQASGDHSTCIGGGATASGEHGTAIGSNSSASSSSAALGAGAKANGSGSIAIGSTAKTTNNGDISIGGGAESKDAGTAIGNGAKGNGNVSIAVGTLSEATAARSISIGYSAKATAENSIQVGEGTNAAANTAKIKNTTILNSQGKIPLESTNIQAGENITIRFSDNGSVISATGGTADYEEIANKPKINAVELSGDKTSADLGLQSQLVSGTNIKTVNGTSLLGSGNIEITGGLPDLPSAFYSHTSIADVLNDSSIPDGVYQARQDKAFQDSSSAAGGMYIDANSIVLIQHGQLSTYSRVTCMSDTIQYGDSDGQYFLQPLFTELDEEPTADSYNAVTSGAVYTAIQSAVGDIDTALQSLHTSLQELISGGGVQ